MNNLKFVNAMKYFTLIAATLEIYDMMISRDNKHQLIFLILTSLSLLIFFLLSRKALALKAFK